jgi:hypothetical protein
MPNALTDLVVEYVSLVDRAAARDPADPTQPQTFLLWKSDSSPAGVADPDDDLDDEDEDEDEDEVAKTALAVAKALRERDEARDAARTAEQVTKALEERATTLKRSKQMTQITKTSEVSASGRAAIRRAVAELTPYGDDDQVAGLISKLSEMAGAPPADPVGKAAGQLDTRELETVLLASAGLGAGERAKVAKASRNAQMEYLRAMSPQAADAVGRGTWRDAPSTTPARKGDAETTLTQEARDIRKADPNVSEYDATVRALRENPAAAAAYLESVR